MAKKKVVYTPEKDYVYSEETKTAAEPSAAVAYRTPEERAAINQAAINAANAAAAPTTPETYRTPEQRALMNQATLRAASERAKNEPLNPHALGNVDPIYQNAGQATGSSPAGTGVVGTGKAESGTKPITAESKLAEILNGEKFSYDLNADPTFQTLLAQYRREGKGAMRDTMAQATALTGGYANSAAQAAAQQAYDRRMDEAFEQVPELEANAYARYRDERSDLYNEYSILAAREAAENEEAWRQKEWDLQLERYRVADEQWAKEYGLNVDKFMQDKYEFQESLKLQWADMDLKQKEYALEKWYKEQGIELSRAELQETIRQFNAEMGYKYYAQDQDNAYKYAALAQDDKQHADEMGYKYSALKQDNDQFYANLYKSGGGGSGGGNGAPSGEDYEEEDPEKANFTGSVSLKTDKDWSAAVNKVAAEMRRGTFKLSSLYKYSYEQAVALIKRANDLNATSTATKSTIKSTTKGTK